MTRRATVRGRRTAPDGAKLIQVVCPVCDGRHWIEDTNTGECLCKPGTFTIHPSFYAHHMVAQPAWRLPDHEIGRQGGQQGH